MPLSQRAVRTAVSVAVLAGATAVAFQFSTGSAAADTATVLPVASVADLVVDGAHQRVFISDPTGGRLVTTDYAGTVLSTVDGLPGVRDLVLADRLYAAVPEAGTIVAFDPATTKRVGSYATGGAPRTLAVTAGKVWFGEDGRGLGSLDLSGAAPVVTRGSDRSNPYTEGDRWSSAPRLATSPKRPGLVAAVDPGTTDALFSILDVTTDPPTPVAHRRVGDRGIDLAFSPDGSRLIVASVQNEVHALATDDLATIERYEPTDYFPRAVAVRDDGAVAVSAGSDWQDAVGIYAPGNTYPAKKLDVQKAADLTLDLTSIGRVLAWEPGGVRLFSVAEKGSTNASHPESIHTLQVLNDPAKTPVTVQLAVPATAQPGKAYTVNGIISTPVPAGLPLVITRTDPSTPGGRRVGPQTVPEYNSFAFEDVQPVAGTVTYTVSIPGNDKFAAGTATASVLVAASRPTTLALNRNGSTWAFGTTVSFTAKLGATHQNRVVELWADPAGNDQPNRLLKKASVEGKGYVTANLKLARNTTVSAVFRGDDFTPAQTVKSTVVTKANVTTTVARHYKTGKIGSQSYYYFRKSKHPQFTTTINPYPGRKQYLQIDVFTRGRWILWGPAYYQLNAAGKSVRDLKGTHSTGIRYRMRSAYLNGKSGDTANATAYGPYRYFTFTK